MYPKNISRGINQILPENEKVQAIYNDTKLRSKFSPKGNTKIEHHMIISVVLNVLKRHVMKNIMIKLKGEWLNT